MAVDMYLEIPEIKGESQKKGYEDQMDILSFSDGVTQHTSFGVLGKGGGSGRAEFQDIHIMKYVDKASSLLWKACANHQHFDKATIHFVKHGENPMEYWTVKLEDVAISSVQTTGNSNADNPMESRHARLRQDHENLHRAEGGWRTWVEGGGRVQHPGRRIASCAHRLAGLT